MRWPVLALLVLAGCGKAPTATVVPGPLAGLTLRSGGLSGVLAADGSVVRVEVVYLWEFADSTYAFLTDWPGPREVRTNLPDGTAPYRAAGSYWVECDPGHTRACLLVVERLSGQTWSWRDAGMDSIGADVWAADVVIGEQSVRLGPVVYQIMR